MNSLYELLGYLVRKRLFLMVHFILAVILAVVYVFFFVKPQYASSITFLPPYTPQTSIIAGLTGLGGLNGGSANVISSAQIPLIFESHELQKKMVDKFDLISKYKLKKSPNKYVLAYKNLSKDLTLETTERGSFALTEILSYTMTFYHTSPDTAFLGVQEYFIFVDSTLRSINSDQNRRSREFLEAALNQHRIILDSLNVKFVAFQNKEKIYDLTTQLSMTLSSYSDIKAKLTTNEIKVKLLENEQDPDHPEIASLIRENGILLEKLKMLEKGSDSSAFISLGQTTRSQAEFVAFTRDIETENKVISLLTQQLEEARISEINSASSFHVIDKAVKPEYKSRPKRLFLLVSISTVYFFTVLTILVIVYMMKYLAPNTKLFKVLNDHKGV